MLICNLEWFFRFVCWFNLIGGLCFENSLQIILTAIFKICEICGDSVLVSDARINSNIGFVIFAFGWPDVIWQWEHVC